MAIAHDASDGRSWSARLLTTDFCPWANRFVYWLKEPVGWLVLASIVSAVIGFFVAPIGWTLATSLVALITVGMIWPALAVRSVTCKLTPSVPQVHEGQQCDLRLAIRNRIPIPIYGLAVEGFLDRKSSTSNRVTAPTVALALVRGSATSTFRFAVRPELRGYYPDSETVLTCSFPFGIWTAKRKLRQVATVTVWPKAFPIEREIRITGTASTEIGAGVLCGRSGDFVGVRDYRHGDSLREINWVATARTGGLVVTERGGPHRPNLQVILDTSCNPSDRSELDDRVRIVASIISNLYQSTVPFTLHLGEQHFHTRSGWEGFAQMMDALASLPVDGIRDTTTISPTRDQSSILVSPRSSEEILVCVSDAGSTRRGTEVHAHRIISRRESLEDQLQSLWTEVRRERLVA